MRRPAVRRKRTLRLWGLLIASLSLVAGLVVPGAIARAAEVTDGLVAWYKLDAASGTTVADASGNNRTATVNGTATFGGDEGLAFNGSNTYLKLPDNLMRGLDSISVSMDVLVDPTQTGAYWLYGFGNIKGAEGNGYLFATGNRFRTSISLASYRDNGEKKTEAGRDLARGVWKHVTYTQTGSTGVLYEDGAQVATNTGVTVLPSAIGAGTTTANYVGKSLYAPDALFKGRMRDFRVFNRALTTAEAGQLSEAWRSRAVDLDKAALTLGDISQVTANLALPTSGRNGSTISWSSSNTSVVGNDGKVIRPSSGQPDATVRLTATLSRSGVQDTKFFTATVLADLDDSAKVTRAKDALVVYGVEDVRGNLTLPVTGLYGSTITWRSDPDKWILTSGEVNRPKPGADKVTVNLTATLRVNQAESSRTFTAIVAPLPEPQALKGYMFSYFTGEGSANGEQVYFGLSRGNDPLRWRELNGGQPVLTSTLGEKGLRDPFIIRSPEGDKFYQIATDLKINGAGGDAWGKSQTTGSKSIMVWESTDLVKWTNQRLVKVSPDTAGNTWAPEAFYDSSLGAYVVFWASKIYAANDPNHTGGTHNKMMYATTRDFYTFSEPKVWNDPGHSVIDSTMIKHDGVYYRFTKDEQGGTGCTNGKYIFAEKSTSIAGPYTSVKRCIGQNGLAAGQSGEGPLVFKSNTEDKWYLFIDEYGGRGYIPFETTDLELKNDSWKPSTGFTMPSPRTRHGTVLPVTQAEYDRLIKTYGGKAVAAADNATVVTTVGHAPTLPATVGVKFGDGTTGTAPVTWEAVPASAYATAGTFTVKGTLTDDASIGVQAIVTVRGATDLLLQYKFDETGGTVVHDASGQGNDGTFVNTPAFGTGVQGGSFKMAGGAKDSTTAPYASIPNGVLGGLDSVTVSTYVKWDSADINNQWIFGLGPDNQKYLFATPSNGDKQTYSGITTGSWNTESKLPGGPNLPRGKWRHVTVVLDSATKTAVLYLDGIEAARATNVPVKPSDLYDPTKGYSGFIGKSLYAGADPYFAGEVDDFRIYGRALSATEVFAVGGDTTSILKVTLDQLKVPAIVDRENARVVLPIKPGTSLTKLAPEFTLAPGASINPASGTARDFTGPVAYTVKGADGKERVWTLEAKIMKSPVIPGLYADPNIAVFDNKFWIYPTTDGFASWKGTQFKAFSSTDLVTWKDHGVILDLGPDVSWADDSAWAPAIGRRNGKYYFYFSGGMASGDTGKHLGVAVADSPAGPFKDALGKPLVKAGEYGGQMIDSAVFTDDDGQPYLYWGNGSSYQVPLNDDMVSFDKAKVKTYKPTNYNEGTFVFKRKGIYYFTWSENDTRSENYQVAYATGSSPLGPWSARKGVILAKDLSLGIKGPGHHSVVQVPGTDDWYIAYHRFAIPDGDGMHRETTIDRLEFDADGSIKKVVPTLESVEPVGTVDAGPDPSGVEGGTIALAGRTPQNEAATWSYRAASGVDSGATCSFADAGAAKTTVTCTDDGVYTVTLTSGDVSDAATLTVDNGTPDIGAPTLATSAVVGQEVTLSASVTDPGRHDTHSCTVDWQDGRTSTVVADNGRCTAGHAFAAAGSYRPRITVTDDDGGVDSEVAKTAVTVTGPGPSPSPSASASPSPSASPSASASPSPSAGSPTAGPDTGPGGDGGLPTTGFQTALVGGAGIALVGVGILLYLMGRRRRTVTALGNDC